MIAPMEWECMLTGNSISDTLKVWQTVLRRDTLVSLCQRNMLSIDCDHDPVNGLFSVSTALRNIDSRIDIPISRVNMRAIPVMKSGTVLVYQISEYQGRRTSARPLMMECG
jgi:hypothetical protein